MAGPWDDVLNATFTDPDARQEVEDFLKTNVQPYVTQLEDQRNLSQDAQRLYDDLTTDPGETYAALTAELFPDRAEQVLALLQEGNTEGAAAAIEAGKADVQQSALSSDDQEIIDWARDRQRQEKWDTAVNDLTANLPEDEKVSFNEKLFTPFVAITGGDFEAAYEGYKEYMSTMRAQLQGLSPEQVAALKSVGQAPPTINSDSGSNTPGSTQTSKEGQSLNDAIDDFLADIRKAPPTV